MKNVLWLIALCCGAMVFCSPVDAQQSTSNGGTITVRTSDLPADLLASLQQKQQVQALDTRVKQYGEWVGIGKEVGIAVNEGLEAVTDKAEKFAQTTPGKVTIAVIIWKVVGRDIMGVIVGIPLVITLTWLYVYSWKALFRGKSVFVGYDAENKKKRYEFKDSAYSQCSTDSSRDNILTCAGIIFLIYVVATGVIVGNVIF